MSTLSVRAVIAKNMAQRKLDTREARFIEEYLIDLDPKRAAIEAGYSKSMAASKAYQWVSNGKVKPHVYEAVRKQFQKRSERTELTQDMVVNELRKIGFADIRKVISWGERPVLEEMNEDDDLRTYPVELIASENIDDDTAAAISEVVLTAQGVKVRLHDKLRALVNLGKHLGMFPQRLEHLGRGGGPIETVDLTTKEFARRALFLLAEAQEQAKELEDQDVEGEAS
jgi:phage terminase small subunit